ncbi:hypothetical protein L1987_72240 [Smallanthus sonchifolius]|uniref:Uncharacterized protein n=1 Tax=Smallanthus sonchifolius TaxID=185202 RepID=A0ACB9AU30_9ASTR|nr:hypothetical protein L1987_72240 [Smallanthus sonchifolius]
MAPTTAILTTPSKPQPPLASHGDPAAPQTLAPSNSPEKSSGDFTAKVTVAGGVTHKNSTPDLSAKTSIADADGDEIVK